jgi:hypothetical protein
MNTTNVAADVGEQQQCGGDMSDDAGNDAVRTGLGEHCGMPKRLYL